MNSITDIWEMILKRLREELYETTINTWFDEIVPVTLEGNTLVLYCPNDFKRGTVEDRFSENIARCLKDIFSVDFTIRFMTNEEYQAHLNGGEKKKRPTSMLESDEFTFENFVIGPSNDLAFGAAKAVAAEPGAHYNPLFIYGASGLGKTHLIYAIAREVRLQNPGAKIVYVKGDSFTNELIQSIQDRTNAEFREKYRQADLLLMDDVQFIAGRKQTQDEFFHTFNTLYESKRQIVLTSDRPPREMSQLEERLQSRFEWGLMVDVQPPELETRIAIIKNKAAQLGFVLDDGTINYIAKNITANVRQLEGAVKKVKAIWDMEKDRGQDSIDRAIRDMMRKEKEYVPSPDIIIAEVCRYYRTDEKAIRGKQRDRNTVRSRQLAMYLIRKIGNVQLKNIGKEFGDRDHATVSYAINQMEKFIAEDEGLAETVRDITANINEHR